MRKTKKKHIATNGFRLVTSLATIFLFVELLYQDYPLLKYPKVQVGINSVCPQQCASSIILFEEGWLSSSFSAV